MTLDKYLSITHPHYVSDEDILKYFLEEELYMDFLEDPGTSEESLGGALSSRIKLTMEEAVVVMAHASVANFMRLQKDNIYPNGEAGFLAGAETSALCCSVRLHSIHNALRLFDLNTLVYRVAAESSLPDTLAECRKTLVSDTGAKEEAKEILSQVLFGALIIRMFSRPHALEEYCRLNPRPDLARPGLRLLLVPARPKPSHTRMMTQSMERKATLQARPNQNHAPERVQHL
jgi:hypothetical protein